MDQVKAMKAEIERLKAGGASEGSGDVDQRVNDLKAKLQSAQREIAELRQRISELQAQQPPPPAA